MRQTADLHIKTFDNGSIDFNGRFDDSTNSMDVLIKAIVLQVTIRAQQEKEAPVVFWKDVDELLNKAKSEPNMFKV